MATAFAPTATIVNAAMKSAGQQAVDAGFELSFSYEHTKNPMEAVYVKAGRHETCELAIENTGRGTAVVHRNDYTKNDSQTFYGTASASNELDVRTLLARKVN